MKLTAQIEYAYWAMLDIAERYHPNTTINLNEISKRNGIPEKYLLQVMLKLKKSGMVSSRRGSGGGFQLTRPPEQIYLSEIVEVLGGSQNGVQSSFKGKTRPNPNCAFFDIWTAGQSAFYKELKQFSLKSLLMKEKRAKKRSSK